VQLFVGQNQTNEIAFVFNALASLSVSGVRFEKSGLGAFYSHACGTGGVTLTDNVVTNVVPLYFGPRYWAMGFIFGAFIGDDYEGNLSLENNYIDIWGPDVLGPNPKGTNSRGISISNVVPAIKAHVRQNTIKNPGVFGIELAAAPNAEIWVEKNNVSARWAIQELNDPTLPWGFGIDVEPLNNPLRLPPKVHISQNILNYSADHGAIRLAQGRPGSTVDNNNIILEGELLPRG
jgi:hypothetical protein